MHRSGTSFAAQALELLGVSFGDPALLMLPGPDNPSGYWENRAIKDLDDELLVQLGGSWDSPPVLDPGWELDPSLDDLRSRAERVLVDSFGTHEDRARSVAWKDPRLALVLPFWRTVADITTTIVVVRDPAEVAASLGARNAMSPSQATVLWLRYVFAAAENDPGHLRLAHSSFFEDLPGTLAAIAAHLELPDPDPAVIAEVEAHFDPTLHHHRASELPRDDENPIVQLAARVWNGGDVRLDAVPDDVSRAIARGWLRPPVDTEAFDRTRARVVELTDLLQKRTRKRSDGG
jgi:hypothetical protein